jgi:hypothetical protein
MWVICSGILSSLDNVYSLLYSEGDAFLAPPVLAVSFASRRKESKPSGFYFLRAFGARCDNALAAAIFAGLELFGLLRTDEAALAARALVLR